jgi:hypothetical protein
VFARRAVLVLFVAMALAAAVAASASADGVPVPPGAAQPGSDPNHGTPLEVLASSIASHIAGRAVSVHCESQDDWNAVALEMGLDPGAELGFVPSPYVYVLSDTFVTSATTAYLSPAVCLPLEQFAEAVTKPTKCQAVTSIRTDVVHYRSVTRYRTVVVNGRRRRVAYTVKVPYTATVTTHGLAAPAPCFLGTTAAAGSAAPGECWSGVCYTVGADEPAAFWDGLEADAEAIIALAHEPIHLWQDQAGARVPADSLVESQAECSAMQWTSYVAEQLGDTPDDAQAIASYFWLLDYPADKLLDEQDPYAAQYPYWSADCRPGGPLDIRGAGSTAWP